MKNGYSTKILDLLKKCLGNQGAESPAEGQKHFLKTFIDIVAKRKRPPEQKDRE
jgi:hypothetical protein